MSKCKCPDEVPKPPGTYVAIYWDCGSETWQVATADLCPSKEEAIGAADQFGSPRHVRYAEVVADDWFAP